MHDPTPYFSDLLELLNVESKRGLDRHCKKLTVYQQDLVALILAAQRGVLSPYLYANHFERSLPSHLHPTEVESDAIANNGPGCFHSRVARKFARKLFQMFREQRALAAHLFYTPSQNHWHLFFFDNRDTDERQQNHWRHGGAHIHYVSNLWPELNMALAWSKVMSGELSFGNKLHLRYRRRYSRV